MIAGVVLNERESVRQRPHMSSVTVLLADDRAVVRETMRQSTGREKELKRRVDRSNRPRTSDTNRPWRRRYGSPARGHADTITAVVHGNIVPASASNRYASEQAEET